MSASKFLDKTGLSRVLEKNNARFLRFDNPQNLTTEQAQTLKQRLGISAADLTKADVEGALEALIVEYGGTVPSK